MLLHLLLFFIVWESGGAGGTSMTPGYLHLSFTISNSSQYDSATFSGWSSDVQHAKGGLELLFDLTLESTGSSSSSIISSMSRDSVEELHSTLFENITAVFFGWSVSGNERIEVSLPLCHSVENISRTSVLGDGGVLNGSQFLWSTENCTTNNSAVIGEVWSSNAASFFKTNFSHGEVRIYLNDSLTTMQHGGDEVVVSSVSIVDLQVYSNVTAAPYELVYGSPLAYNYSLAQQGCWAKGKGTSRTTSKMTLATLRTSEDYGKGIALLASLPMTARIWVGLYGERKTGGAWWCWQESPYFSASGCDGSGSGGDYTMAVGNTGDGDWVCFNRPPGCGFPDLPGGGVGDKAVVLLPLAATFWRFRGELVSSFFHGYLCDNWWSLEPLFESFTPTLENNVSFPIELPNYKVAHLDRTQSNSTSSSQTLDSTKTASQVLSRTDAIGIVSRSHQITETQCFNTKTKEEILQTVTSNQQLPPQPEGSSASSSSSTVAADGTTAPFSSTALSTTTATTTGLEPTTPLLTTDPPLITTTTNAARVTSLNSNTGGSSTSFESSERTQSDSRRESGSTFRSIPSTSAGSSGVGSSLQSSSKVSPSSTGTNSFSTSREGASKGGTSFVASSSLGNFGSTTSSGSSSSSSNVDILDSYYAIPSNLQKITDTQAAPVLESVVVFSVLLLNVLISVFLGTSLPVSSMVPRSLGTIDVVRTCKVQENFNLFSHHGILSPSWMLQEPLPPVAPALFTPSVLNGLLLLITYLVLRLVSSLVRNHREKDVGGSTSEVDSARGKQRHGRDKGQHPLAVVEMEDPLLVTPTDSTDLSNRSSSFEASVGKNATDPNQFASNVPQQTSSRSPAPIIEPQVPPPSKRASLFWPMHTLKHTGGGGRWLIIASCLWQATVYSSSQEVTKVVLRGSRDGAGNTGLHFAGLLVSLWFGVFSITLLFSSLYLILTGIRDFLLFTSPGSFASWMEARGQWMQRPTQEKVVSNYSESFIHAFGWLRGATRDQEDDSEALEDQEDENSVEVVSREEKLAREKKQAARRLQMLKNRSLVTSEAILVVDFFFSTLLGIAQGVGSLVTDRCSTVLTLTAMCYLLYAAGTIFLRASRFHLINLAPPFLCILQGTLASVLLQADNYLAYAEMYDWLGIGLSIICLLITLFTTLYLRSVQAFNIPEVFNIQPLAQSRLIEIGTNLRTSAPAALGRGSPTTISAPAPVNVVSVLPALASPPSFATLTPDEQQSKFSDSRSEQRVGPFGGGSKIEGESEDPFDDL